MQYRRELPGIHALRLGASLVIAAYHVDVSGIAGTYLPWLASLAGPRAVAPSLTSLFLTLSGFGLFYADATRRDPRPRTPGEFWRARASRLVPLMLVGHLVVAPFALVGASRYAGGEVVPRALLVASATQSWYPPYALSFNAPAWTLSVLAFGYLLYPRLAAGAGRLGSRAAAFLLAGIWIASIATSYLVLLGGDGPADTTSTAHAFAHVFPPIRVLEFVSGILLGRLWVLARGRFTAAWAVVALLPALLLVAALGTGLLNPRPAGYLGYGGLMPIWWVLIWLIAAVSLAPGRARWTQALGRSSFAVYILHAPLLAIVNSMLHRGWFGEYSGVVLGLWFASLIPVGLAAERWFVEPVAARLRASRAGDSANRASVRTGGASGGALPTAARDTSVSALDR